MMIGLKVDNGGFDVLVGDSRIGPCWTLEADDVGFLDQVTARYSYLTRSRADDAALAGVGRKLFDGAEYEFSVLMERTPAPLVFEVQCPRTPTESAWAVLRAPWAHWRTVLWPQFGSWVAP
ncbi:hypothetical protein [Nocardia lijiangensis]|uniref:hypothetical protein n=1 Tax=Nocardia lijiangensis TaxID=299618 RepID=UPI003D745EC3